MKYTHVKMCVNKTQQRQQKRPMRIILKYMKLYFKVCAYARLRANDKRRRRLCTEAISPLLCFGPLIFYATTATYCCYCWGRSHYCCCVDDFSEHSVFLSECESKTKIQTEYNVKIKIAATAAAAATTAAALLWPFANKQTAASKASTSVGARTRRTKSKFLSKTLFQTSTAQTQDYASASPR